MWVEESSKFTLLLVGLGPVYVCGLKSKASLEVGASVDVCGLRGRVDLEVGACVNVRGCCASIHNGVQLSVKGCRHNLMS